MGILDRWEQKAEEPEVEAKCRELRAATNALNEHLKAERAFSRESARKSHELYKQEQQLAQRKDELTGQLRQLLKALKPGEKVDCHGIHIECEVPAPRVVIDITNEDNPPMAID